VKLAGDGTELRKSNFKSLQSQFRNFFSVRNSAIDLVVRNIAELRTKISDAHFWLLATLAPDSPLLLLDEEL
jgi:hypothetical protein